MDYRNGQRMEDNNLPKILAECETKGYVIAPAGYGKTYLIAQAVKEASNRQLILTHTTAGVYSLKNKMKALNIPTSLYTVDTIASWALQLCMAYPKNASFENDNPQKKEEWHNLYALCAGLLSVDFIRRIVIASYFGVYVDEYQDCSNVQHALISSLADILPCRILGDPLQAIFDFSDHPVDWDTSVYPEFICLGQLKTPWRWMNAGTPELGKWLQKTRIALEEGGMINLDNLPKEVKLIVTTPEKLLEKQYFVLDNLANKDDAVIAMHGGRNKYKTHMISSRLGGKFSSIEEIECKDLFRFLKILESGETPKEKFLSVVEFIQKSCTSIKKILVSKNKKGEIAKASKRTNYLSIPAMDSANLYLLESTSKNLLIFIMTIIEHPMIKIYRQDLFGRFLDILKIHIDNKDLTIGEAANIFQRKFRKKGRRFQHTKLIGTTLLVKGLEYGHAVLLEANALNFKELYVAMTRGAKSLTIITTKKILPFTENT